jgi:hypothetical protein
MTKSYQTLVNECTRLEAKQTDKIRSINKSLLKQITIDDDEEIQYIQSITGKEGVLARSGNIFITNKKVIVALSALVGGYVTSYLYNQISSVQAKTGLLVDELEISTTGNQTRSICVSKSKNVAQIIRENIERANNVNVNTTTIVERVSDDDFTVKLERLQRLKDTGTINQEEFDKMKQNIINNL